MKAIIKKFSFALIAFSIAIVFGVSAQAADGDLDTTFGTGGMMTVDFDANPDPNGTDRDTGLDTAIQTDGKIIIVGESSISASDTVFSATRLNTDGSLDTTFADGGRFLYNPNSGSGTGRAYAVAVQADGKILIAGRTGNPRDRIVLRLNADGTLDTTFGSAGVFKEPIGSTRFDEPEIVIQPDGKIIVSGAMQTTGLTTDSFSVMRLNANGTLDTSFDADGKVETNFAADDRAYGVILQADGKIIAFGSTNNNAGYAIARYNTDGSLDATFDGDGKVTTAFPGMTGLIYDMAIQPDGKLLAGGYVRGLHSDAAVTRYNADGSLDASFGTNGTATFGLTNQEVLWNVYYKDGKILGTGTRNPGAGFGSPDDFMLLRFNGDGSLDTGFGDQGVIYTNFGQREICLTSAFQPDGKLVLAGYQTGSQAFNPDFLAVRYEYSSSGTNRAHLDFFGSGRTSFALTRVLNGNFRWLIQNNGGEGTKDILWGLQTDRRAPGYYDNDNKVDISVWRSGDQGIYYTLSSETDTLSAVPWGRSVGGGGIGPDNFQFFNADYDGDGLDDYLGVRIQDSTYYWLFLRSSDNTLGVRQWGSLAAGHIPMPSADYTGDGKADLVVLTAAPIGQPPLPYQTYLVNDIVEGTLKVVQDWGVFATDFYVTGDYLGDDRADFAVWRGAGPNSDGYWHIKENGGTGQTVSVKFGISQAEGMRDIAIRGDYNGDGKDDPAVYRPSNSTFYWLNSPDFKTFGSRQFGEPSSNPIANIGVR